LQSDHLKPRKLWEYIYSKTELTHDQHMHIIECTRCLEMFRLCVLSDSPESAERNTIQNDLINKRPA
jgi:hypothetical protein